MSWITHSHKTERPKKEIRIWYRVSDGFDYWLVDGNNALSIHGVSVLLFLDERERVRGRVVRKSGLGLRAVSTTKCTRSDLGWLN